jgi:glycerophosphoryl diester phosphodiesterase
MISPSVDIQGHRGCRGLMPENTIEGFLKAIDYGVTTLEMDVVISKDRQVVVSHEPFFNHEISTHYDSSITITEANEKTFNIYEMDVEEIQKFDVGTRSHPRFPLQSKFRTHKPTLLEVVTTAESYIAKQKLPAIYYNIEIKHLPEFDDVFHPKDTVFTKLVYDLILQLGIQDRTTVQSFDPACLNILHAMDASITTALLVENLDSVETNLDKLTFTPRIYSPYFKLIDDLAVKKCHEKNIKVIPWTVNEASDIIATIQLGVDGIISDFPDRVIELYAGIKPIK